MQILNNPLSQGTIVEKIACHKGEETKGIHRCQSWKQRLEITMQQLSFREKSADARGAALAVISVFHVSHGKFLTQVHDHMCTQKDP